jgi:hypothetical protein
MTEEEQAKENVRKVRPYFFLIVAVICGFMYMVAFHNKRSENKELKHEIEMLNLKLENCEGTIPTDKGTK